MWLAVKCCSQIPLLCAVLPMSREVSHWLIAVRNENHPKRPSWKASPLPVSSHSLLLRHIRWLLPARAPTTAAAVAALQAGTSSVKPTSTSEGWPPPPPTMTWSSSVSREYCTALPLVIFCYRSAVDLFIFFCPDERWRMAEVCIGLESWKEIDAMCSLTWSNWKLAVDERVCFSRVMKGKLEPFQTSCECLLGVKMSGRNKRTVVRTVTDADMSFIMHAG